MSEKQIPFRCPAELLDRFNAEKAKLRPEPSRNALLVCLVEDWIRIREGTGGEGFSITPMQDTPHES